MDGRAHKRVAIDREVQCKIDGVPGWVMIYDLSAGGAMIEVAGYRMAVGDPVELDLYDLITMTGRVVWKVGTNAGVKFDSLVSDWILGRLGVTNSSLRFDELPARDRYGQIISESPSAPVPPPEDRHQPSGDAPPTKADAPSDIDVKAALGTALGSCIQGRLVNLTVDGCTFLDPSATFKPGDAVWLQFETLLPWQSTVRWAEGGQVGVAFERPLHPAIADHIVKGTGEIGCFSAA